MFKTFQIDLSERAIVMKDGLPVRALGPGSHRVWGFSLSERRWSTSQLVFEMAPELRAVLPKEWFEEVALGPSERAVLSQDGRPKMFLGPGVHRYWQADDSIRVQTYSVHEKMPELTSELAAIIPRDAYVDATVLEHERGLHYVQGRLVQTLPPGRYTFWTTRESPVSVEKVDTRATQVTIAGQELMTRDKVTLRLSLTIEYAVSEPALTASVTSNVRDALYLVVQLAARTYLSGVTLDELLTGRDAMTRFLEEDAVDKARRFGVRVDRVGVKDIVLPGEMKTLLNKVIEAEKEAAANVILRREETAATRSLANTAKVMAEQPILLRLKELESLKEIASKVKELRVVTGADALGTLGGFLPHGLLSGDSSSSSSGTTSESKT
jgi:regulator of protease activity HflC (stomatin/prohibitin superfamily)